MTFRNQVREMVKEYLLIEKGSQSHREKRGSHQQSLRDINQATDRIISLIRDVMPEEEKMTTYLGQNDEVDTYRKGKNAYRQELLERIEG